MISERYSLINSMTLKKKIDNYSKSYSIILFLSIGCLVLSLIYSNVHKKYKYILNEYIICSSESQQNVENEAQAEKSMESINCKLSDGLVLTDWDGESLLFEELSITKETVFFRFMGSNCSACLEQEFENMKQSQLKDITFLVSGSEFGYLARMQRTKQINYRILFVDDLALDIPVESLNLPYYFTLNADNLLKFIFIPDRLKPQQSINFFKSIERINVLQN